MVIPEELEWLARNESAWHGTQLFARIGRDDYNEIFYSDLDGYTRAQWQAARRELGLDVGDIEPDEEEGYREAEKRMIGTKSKYHKRVKGVDIDVYDVLKAFGVTNQADAHAIKKMLMPGQRGAKDAIQDRREAIQSLERAIELEEE